MTEIAGRDNLPTFDFVMDTHNAKWAEPVRDHIASTPGVVAVAFEVIGNTPEMRADARPWLRRLDGPAMGLMESLGKAYPLHCYDAPLNSPEEKSFFDALADVASVGRITDDLDEMRAGAKAGLRKFAGSDHARERVSAVQLTEEIAPRYAHIPGAVISVYGGLAHKAVASSVEARGYPTRLTTFGGDWPDLRILDLLRQDPDADIPSHMLDRYLLDQVLNNKGTLMPDGAVADVAAAELAVDFVKVLPDDIISTCLEGITAAQRRLQSAGTEGRRDREQAAIDWLLRNAALIGGVQVVNEGFSRHTVEQILSSSHF
jgi:hypothetical protein